MGSEEDKTLSEIKKDFSKINQDSKLTSDEISDFTNDINRLFGLFLIRKDKDILDLIKQMVEFGEKNNFASVYSLRMELDKFLNN